MSETVFTFPAASGDDETAGMEERARRIGLLEAVVFAAQQPPTAEQLAAVAGVSPETVSKDLQALMEACRADDRGVQLRSVGGTYRISTKPEHHEAVRAFAKAVKPKLKLSRAALETLAVVAYKQPVTLPEISAIRGVSSSSGVIRTLLSHDLVAVAGRKKVVGRPICYKTTREFLEHFGLDDLSELPTVKELEELLGPPADGNGQLELLPAAGTGGETDLTSDDRGHD